MCVDSALSHNQYNQERGVYEKIDTFTLSICYPGRVFTFTRSNWTSPFNDTNRTSYSNTISDIHTTTDYREDRNSDTKA